MKKDCQKKLCGIEKWLGLGLLMLGLLVPAISHADQARYIYDDLGRLHAEIDAQGNAIIYNYDAVGNLLSITRTDVSSTGVSITFFSPQKGPVDTEVTIFGGGFSPTPADNQVTFNGTTATVLSSTSTQIVARVPTGATTGPIAVTNSNGSATSADQFTVTQSISVEVSPETAVVVAGTSKQFTVTVTGTTNQEVTWTLDGNGTTVGSISDTGLYSVPSSFTNTALVIIKATSVADPTKSATATVSALSSSSFSPVIAPQVSIAIAPPEQTGLFVAPQVSVAIESFTQSGPFVAPQVSVAVEQAPVSSGPFIGPQVSVSLTPIINGVSPNTGIQGATNLSITLTGTGLAGASSLSFLLNGSTDTSITATNILANAQGTQVTADFTIDSAAPTGLRVIRVTTPDGISPATATEGDTFIVTTP